MAKFRKNGMSITRNSILPLVLALLLCISGCANQKKLKFEYIAFPTEYDTTYAISGVANSDGTVYVPTEYNGCAVTTIWEDAFRSATKADTVILESITRIENRAFAFLSLLKRIDLGRVEHIGDLAFQCCYSLTSITIPATTKTLGNGVFSQCKSLTAVYFEGIPEQIGGDVFYLNEVYGPRDLVIYGIPGSTVEEYAAQNGYTFVDIATVK